MFYKVFNPENETKTLVVEGLQYVILGRDYIIVEPEIAFKLREMWAGFEVVTASDEEVKELKVAEITSDEKSSDEKETKYVKPRKNKK